MEQKFHGNKKVIEGGEAMFKQRGKGKNSSQRKTIFKLKEFFELPGSRDQKKSPLEIPRECSNSKDTCLALQTGKASYLHRTKTQPGLRLQSVSQKSKSSKVISTDNCQGALKLRTRTHAT